VYPITIGSDEYDIWRIERTAADKIYLPNVSFDYLDYHFEFYSIEASLELLPGPWGTTAYPIPFGADDLYDGEADVRITKPADPTYLVIARMPLFYITATSVPEPAAALLTMPAILTFATLRRRRSA
jgi:hypothetical protein